MGEHEKSVVPGFPFIGVDEFMDMFGVTPESAFFASEDDCRAFIGNLLNRATNWFKVWSGYNIDSSETLSDALKTGIGDVIYARAAYFTYLRMSNLDVEKDHYRSLARMQMEEFKMGKVAFRKNKSWSRYILRSDIEMAAVAKEV